MTRYAKKKIGANGEYLPKIVREIGMMPIAEIHQETIDALAEKLYPGRSAATLNRHIYTPITAVLNAMASKTYAPPRIKRPEGHLANSNFQKPPKDWFQRVLPECSPNLAAFLLFCRLHGRRTSEACCITPDDIDADTWQVTVRDTKADQVILIKLSTPIIEQLERYSWRLNQYVRFTQSFPCASEGMRSRWRSLPCPQGRQAATASQPGSWLNVERSRKSKTPDAGNRSRCPRSSMAIWNSARLTMTRAKSVRSGLKNSSKKRT